jgi:hypothetical protein
MQDMMVKDFERALLELRGTTVEVSNSGAYPEPGAASAKLLFSDGTWLRTDYWRLIKSGKANVSSFDHQQKYGLSAPIDALLELRQALQNAHVEVAQSDRRTGDLIFSFEGKVELQVLNFTGYEVWEIQFPNGSGEYSPYAK